MSIVLRDIHKAFGEHRVLEGVSLEASDRETHAVIGPSGTGKSVLLKHIVGLLQPDAGEVWVDEQRVADLDSEALVRLRLNIGYVFQFAALFDSLTVSENVALPLERIPEMDATAVEARVTQCLELVEMAGYEGHKPSELSGGQRKRIGLARAIASEPRYLLYDEPTTGLDPVTTTVIDRLVVRMRDELGVTSVLVTHDMKSAARVADRISVLLDGRIRFTGTPRELTTAEDPVVRGFVQGIPELIEEGA